MSDVPATAKIMRKDIYSCHEPFIHLSTPYFYAARDLSIAERGGWS